MAWTDLMGAQTVIADLADLADPVGALTELEGRAMTVHMVSGAAYPDVVLEAIDTSEGRPRAIFAMRHYAWSVLVEHIRAVEA